MTFDPNPMTRNPLQFEDVALAASIHWAVSKKSALNYFKEKFASPQDAFRNLRDNPTFPPESFWQTL